MSAFNFGVKFMLKRNNDIQKIKDLKEKLKIVENERDEVKASLHVVTLHCANLIAEKETKG